MLTALVLICGAQVLDARQCTRETAIDIIVAPESYATMNGCFFGGQAYAAQLANGRDLPPGSMVRVICGPKAVAQD